MNLWNNHVSHLRVVVLEYAGNPGFSTCSCRNYCRCTTHCASAGNIKISLNFCRKFFKKILQKVFFRIFLQNFLQKLLSLHCPLCLRWKIFLLCFYRQFLHKVPGESFCRKFAKTTVAVLPSVPPLKTLLISLFACNTAGCQKHRAQVVCS